MYLLAQEKKMYLLAQGTKKVSRVTYNTGRDQRVHFFGTMRLFQNSHVPSEIRFSSNFFQHYSIFLTIYPNHIASH